MKKPVELRFILSITAITLCALIAGCQQGAVLGGKVASPTTQATFGEAVSREEALDIVKRGAEFTRALGLVRTTPLSPFGEAWFAARADDTGITLEAILPGYRRVLVRSGSTNNMARGIKNEDIIADLGPAIKDKKVLYGDITKIRYHKRGWIDIYAKGGHSIEPFLMACPGPAWKTNNPTDLDRLVPALVAICPNAK